MITLDSLEAATLITLLESDLKKLDLWLLTKKPNHPGYTMMQDMRDRRAAIFEKCRALLTEESGRGNAAL